MEVEEVMVCLDRMWESLHCRPFLGLVIEESFAIRNCRLEGGRKWAAGAYTPCFEQLRQLQVAYRLWIEFCSKSLGRSRLGLTVSGWFCLFWCYQHWQYYRAQHCRGQHYRGSQLFAAVVQPRASFLTA